MGRRPLMTLWYGFNILATLFYGFCHQGGVYSAVNAISGLEMSPRTSEATIVFSNTYMPPKFPLLQAAAPGHKERRRGYMLKNNMRYIDYFDVFVLSYAHGNLFQDPHSRHGW